MTTRRSEEQRGDERRPDRHGSAAPQGDPAIPCGDFDANRLDLSAGIRLLEASAGTGKTFALAHLVLRLVSEAAVPLRQILVVTFTEAAAAELRDRIGRRLQQGLALLERLPTPIDAAGPADAAQPAVADPSTAGLDAVLLGWFQRIAALPAEPIERMRIQVLLALEELAAADITTIHGFCRRTLQREALAAGRSPQLQLEDPDDPAVMELIHGYWRQQVLPLPPHLLAGLRRRGVVPAALERLLRSLDADPALDLDPLPPELCLETGLERQLPVYWQQRWELFRRLWHQHGRTLQELLLEEARRLRQQGAASTDPYKPSARIDRCGEVEAFIAGQGAIGDYDACLQQRWLNDYFHPGRFCKVVREVEQHTDPVVRLPHRPLMEAVAALLDEPAEAVLLHALHWSRRELQRRRRQGGVSSFSQLLRDLDPGPDSAAPSPLLDAVAERYRVALIDEFQDTDPIQWRILRRAFAAGEHLLVMVGDPKQAIYRFRGGDLATYQAAASQADERWQLTGNRRSTRDLVTALNRLMGPGLRRSHLPSPQVQPHAERHGPAGAAIELLWLGPSTRPSGPGDADPGEGDDEPGGDRGEGSGGPAGRHPSRTALEAQLPDTIARHVRDLLARGLMLGEAERSRPLQASDVCLLVSNHRQAEAQRRALEGLGIACRLVSRADVFLSPAGTALQRFLDALGDPADGNRLRLLAASPLLGWSAGRIAAASQEVWGELAGRLTSMAQELSGRGLLGVLVDLLGVEGMARLERGGRLAADLQQLSALVQERLHAEGLAPAAAADWLRRRRLDPPQQLSEEHQAHSDRADGAVSVITIHRSKGLEFPVVICPYLWQSASASGPPALGRRWQPADAASPRLDLHLNLLWGPGHAAERQRREQEEQERERLAYVALTRAQHRLVLAWGPARGQHCAPLLPWLFPHEPLADLDEDLLAPVAAGRWRERLEGAIASGDLPIALLDPPPADPVALRPSREPANERPPLATGPVPARRLDQGWRRSSYSSWVRGHGEAGTAPPLPEAIEEGRDTSDATPSQLLEALEDETGPTAAEPAGGFRTDGPARTVGSGGGGSLSAEPGAFITGGSVEAPHAAVASGSGGGAEQNPADQVRGPDPTPGGSRLVAAPATDSGRSAAMKPAQSLSPAAAAAAGGAGGPGTGWSENGPLADFPAGPLAGDCLHRILERFRFDQPAHSEANRAHAELELRRSGLAAELLPALLQGLETLRCTPFGADLGSLRPADLRAGRWLSEMRFDLSLGHAEAGALAAAFRAWPGGLFDGGYGERLADLPIDHRGFLTGAIDLIFAAPDAGGQERWWVLDWKSNRLGRRDADGRVVACGPRHYGSSAMRQLMVANHYPLQAHLYLVALHRYLRWRLPDYAPERHLGGSVYVFLRGTPGATGERALPGGIPGMLVDRPPVQRLLALDAALGYGPAGGGEDP